MIMKNENLRLVEFHEYYDEYGRIVVKTAYVEAPPPVPEENEEQEKVPNRRGRNKKRH